MNLSAVNEMIKNSRFHQTCVFGNKNVILYQKTKTLCWIRNLVELGLWGKIYFGSPQTIYHCHQGAFQKKPGQGANWPKAWFSSDMKPDASFLGLCSMYITLNNEPLEKLSFRLGSTLLYESSLITEMSRLQWPKTDKARGLSGYTPGKKSHSAATPPFQRRETLPTADRNGK